MYTFFLLYQISLREEEKKAIPDIHSFFWKEHVGT
jgi:hypothetical protein